MNDDDYRTKNAIRRLVKNIALHIDPDVEIHILKSHALSKTEGEDSGKKGRATGLDNQGDELPES